MKVILLKEVKNIGSAGDVKNVSVGFARNFLIPKRLAVSATTEEMKKVEHRQKRTDQMNQKKTEKMSDAFAKLSGVVLTLQRKAQNGTLFAGLHAKEVASELARQHHIILDSSLFVMDQPLKTVGEHVLKARLKDQEAILKIVIEATK